MKELELTDNLEDSASDTTQRRNDPAPLLDQLEFTPEHCMQALSDWSLFPQLLNSLEASWLTRVPIKTLYKWHSEGKLSGVAKTVGKQLRFDRDALWKLWKDETKATK